MNIAHLSLAIVLAILQLFPAYASSVQPQKLTKIDLSEKQMERSSLIEGDAPGTPVCRSSGLYVTAIEINNHFYDVTIDTGSTYTWVIVDGFTCHADNGTNVDPNNCNYGPGLSSDQFNQSETFSVVYGDGSHLSGTNGLAVVSLNGASFNQIIGLANDVSPDGANGTSGVMGLSLPSHDPLAIFPNSDVAIIANLWNQTSDHAKLQLALSRTDTSSDDAGFINFGHWSNEASTAINASGPVAVAPVSWYNNFWNITVDGFTVDGTHSAIVTTEPGRFFFVDSGTTMNFVDAQTAQFLSAAFDPPASYENGTWFVDCDAKTKPTGVKIGGETFFVNPKDLFFRLDETTCISSFLQAGPATNDYHILGQQFLTNVLVEFDVGDMVVRFQARQWY